MKQFKIIFSILLTILAQNCLSEEPITTDNRVKTYIYNENEVYRITIYYGYQTSIEFARDEEVVTISMGDTYAWKLNPIGQRLFIKPLEDDMHTNMTIITNKRAYQFDLFSKKVDNDLNKELVYVMRFYYPNTAEEDLPKMNN